MNEKLFQQYLILTIASLKVTSELTRQLLLSNRLMHKKEQSLNDLDKRMNNFIELVEVDMKEDPESLSNIDIVHESLAELLDEVVKINNYETREQRNESSNPQG